MATKAELEEKLAEYESADIGQIVAERDELKVEVEELRGVRPKVPEVDEGLYPKVRLTNLSCRKGQLGPDLAGHQAVVNELVKAGGYRPIGMERTESSETVEFTILFYRD